MPDWEWDLHGSLQIKDKIYKAEIKKHPKPKETNTPKISHQVPDYVRPPKTTGILQKMGNKYDISFTIKD